MKSIILWLGVVVVIGVLFSVVFFNSSLHDSSEELLWDVSDGFSYLLGNEQQFTPQADANIKCISQASFLIPDSITMEQYKGSNQWYVINSFWTDGASIDSTTYKFENIFVGNTSFYYPVEPLADNLLHYTKDLFSDSGRYLGTISFDTSLTLVSIDSSLEVFSHENKKSSMIEDFDVVDYSISNCVWN